RIMGNTKHDSTRGQVGYDFAASVFLRGQREWQGNYGKRRKRQQEQECTPARTARISQQSESHDSRRLDVLHNAHGLTRPVSTLSQFKLKSGMAGRAGRHLRKSRNTNRW